MSLRLAFYGDDFTGSTDALESLTLAGLKTRLFTKPPTPDMLAGLDAFGIAGTGRAMTPEQMDEHLPPIFRVLRDSGAQIVHYKVCSTFDSSPTIGNIGRVIELASEIFGDRTTPVLAAAPHLGRYCVFGNLFARLGFAGEVFRLDRHPSMSCHPVTPMFEADLRRHLGMQTTRSIGLVPITHLDAELPDTDIAVIDLMEESQLAAVGKQLSKAHFVVGSSGVNAALAAHWRLQPTAMPAVKPAGSPLLVVSGSCSPVTAAQISAAVRAGFVPLSAASEHATERAVHAMAEGRNVIIHPGDLPSDAALIGRRLGELTREIVDACHVRRCLIAGGDTSGAIVQALGLRSLEMIATLIRGAPLCRADTGLELVLKGGQIGPPDLFIRAAGAVPHEVMS
jgi:uncharacterized protein YgbK (DUF1537 family)